MRKGFWNHIAICLLLLWQTSGIAHAAGSLHSMHAQAYAHSATQAKQAHSEVVTNTHSQRHCAGHDSESLRQAAQAQPDTHLNAHVGPGELSQDCCQSSHCQCQFAHMPALNVNCAFQPAALPDSPVRIDLAAPPARQRVFDALRPPI